MSMHSPVVIISSFLALDQVRSIRYYGAVVYSAGCKACLWFLLFLCYHSPDPCRYRDSLANGRIDKGRQTGSNFLLERYSCNTGYRLRGVVTAVCVPQRGWAAALPVCELLPTGM